MAQIRCLPDDAVPRREQSTRDGKEETAKGVGTGAGTRAGTGISTREEMGVRTGAGTGTRIEMKAEERESLGTFEVVKEVGQKTLEGGRRQRVTSNHNRYYINRPDAPARTSSHANDQSPGTGRKGQDRRRRRRTKEVQEAPEEL